MEDQVQCSVSLHSASHHLPAKSAPATEPQAGLRSEPFISALQDGLSGSEEFTIYNTYRKAGKRSRPL